MTDMNDYDDAEDSTVDEDEAKAAEKGAVDSEEGAVDGDLAEAETLTRNCQTETAFVSIGR